MQFSLLVVTSLRMLHWHVLLLIVISISKEFHQRKRIILTTEKVLNTLKSHLPCPVVQSLEQRGSKTKVAGLIFSLFLFKAFSWTGATEIEIGISGTALYSLNNYFIDFQCHGPNFAPFNLPLCCNQGVFPSLYQARPTPPWSCCSMLYGPPKLMAC